MPPDPADEVESDLSLRNPVLMLLAVVVVLVFPESAMAADAAACSSAAAAFSSAAAAFSSAVGRSPVRMMF